MCLATRLLSASQLSVLARDVASINRRGFLLSSRFTSSWGASTDQLDDHAPPTPSGSKQAGLGRELVTDAAQNNDSGAETGAIGRLEKQTEAQKPLKQSQAKTSRTPLRRAPAWMKNYVSDTPKHAYWSAPDDKVLLDRRERGKTYAAIQRAHFPERTSQALAARALSLKNAPALLDPDWSPQQDLQLLLIVRNCAKKKLSESDVGPIFKMAFPERSFDSVLQRALFHRRRNTVRAFRRPTAEAESERRSFRNEWPVSTTTDRELRELALQYRELEAAGHAIPPWTELEDSVLKRNLRKRGLIYEKCELLPHRSHRAVVGRLSYLRRAAGLPKRILSKLAEEEEENREWEETWGDYHLTSPSQVLACAISLTEDRRDHRRRLKSLFTRLPEPPRGYHMPITFWPNLSPSGFKLLRHRAHLNDKSRKPSPKQVRPSSSPIRPPKARKAYFKRPTFWPNLPASAFKLINDHSVLKRQRRQTIDPTSAFSSSAAQPPPVRIAYHGHPRT